MILVIGYGNSLRQDDGAGLKLAELLTRACHQADLNAEQLQMQQLAPELAFDIARPNVQAVVFADTRIMAAKSDAGVRIEPLPIGKNQVPVGHCLTPETVLLYTSLLYNRRPASWLATVPGSCFGHGETISDTTRLALASSNGPIRKWLSEVSALLLI